MIFFNAKPISCPNDGVSFDGIALYMTAAAIAEKNKIIQNVWNYEALIDERKSPIKLNHLSTIAIKLNHISHILYRS
jgi:hypothetical protein